MEPFERPAGSQADATEAGTGNSAAPHEREWTSASAWLSGGARQELFGSHVSRDAYCKGTLG